MTEAQIVALREETDAKIRAIREANKASLKFSQKMKIEQEKTKYKDPASKRGVAFVMECQFGLQELLEHLSPLFNEEGTLLDDKTQDKDQFIRFVRDWGIKRERANKEERESYAIGNRSRHGWLTEKYYRSSFSGFLGECFSHRLFSLIGRMRSFWKTEMRSLFCLQRRSYPSIGPRKLKQNTTLSGLPSLGVNREEGTGAAAEVGGLGQGGDRQLRATHPRQQQRVLLRWGLEEVKEISSQGRLFSREFLLSAFAATSLVICSGNVHSARARNELS